MAEGGVLLRRWWVNACLEGSNPSFSVRRSRASARERPSVRAGGVCFATLARARRGAGAVERGGLENR